MPAMEMMAGKCAGSASGGKITIRRARPSSSINAHALVSWLAVASSTERPPSSRRPAPKLVPRARSVKRIAAPRSKKLRGASIRATKPRSDGASTPAMLINFHEIAERDWKHRFLRGGERIDAETVFQTRDQNGKAERVETAIGEHEIFL